MHEIGKEQSGARRDDAAEAVPEQDIGAPRRCLQQQTEAAGQIIDAVVARRQVGQGAEAIAWRIPCHHAIAGADQFGDLIAPVILGAIAAMQEIDRDIAVTGDGMIGKPFFLGHCRPPVAGC